MEISLIEKHYRDNHQRLIKKMTFRAGTVWAAEDIVHTAYERAIRYRRSCEPNRFGQWFSTLINNALRDYKVEENGRSCLDIDDEDVAASEECPHYTDHVMKEIFELINTKSEVQIEILNMYFKQEFSAKDIAAITEHSYSKTHQIIQRFRNELKELYRDA